MRKARHFTGVPLPLVEPGRREDELAHSVAANNHLLAPQKPSEGDRVGEQNPAARVHEPMPLTQERCSLVQMVDRVEQITALKPPSSNESRSRALGQTKQTRSASPRSRATLFPSAMPAWWMSTPMIRQPVVAAVNSAGPPEPLATSSSLLDWPSSSRLQNTRCSSAVSQEL